MNKNIIQYFRRSLPPNHQFWFIDVNSMKMIKANIIIIDNNYVSIIISKHRRRRIPFIKIDEIRLGQSTDNWIKFKNDLKNKSSQDKIKNIEILKLLDNSNDYISFSFIIKRDNHPILCDSLDFYTENIDLFDNLINKNISHRISAIKQMYNFDNHHKMLEFLYQRYLIKDHPFQIENNDNNNTVDTDYRRLRQRFRKLLNRLNVNLDGQYFRFIMQMNDKLKSKDKMAIIDLINRFDNRPYFNFLFKKYSITDDNGMCRKELKDFFIQEQNEILTEKELDEIMLDFGNDINDGVEQRITLNSFYYLMESSKWSELFDDDQYHVCQDMTRPMTDYFISSSHNSYLSGNQLTSESSYEMYRQILLTGCRCIEIDVWDHVGEGGIGTTRPVIKHGYTFTSKIELQGVLETINDVAFTKSDYPLIISVENRCKNHENHRRIADLMHAIFKERLYIAEIDDDCQQYPSPEEMRGKIFIKCSKNQSLNKNYLSDSDFNRHIELWGVNLYLIPDERRREHLQQIKRQKLSKRDRNDPIIFIKNDVEEDDEKYLDKRFFKLSNIRIEYNNIDDDVDDVDDNEMSKLKSSAHHWDESFSKLINYFESRKFHSIEECNRDFKFYHMISRDESQSLDIDMNEYREFTKNHMVRVYPSGWRQNSSNYWPIDHWINGAQLVALNYQRSTLPMFINNALFSLNGKCGYVLKPKHLLHDYHYSFENNKKRLIIRILSGQFWNAFYEDDCLRKDVYLKIVIRIYCGEKKYRQITETNKNGFNPLWNETFEFIIDQPELTFVHFTLTNCDDFFGHYLISMNGMRKGYRFIPLYDKEYCLIKFTKLFLKIDVENC